MTEAPGGGTTVHVSSKSNLALAYRIGLIWGSGVNGEDQDQECGHWQSTTCYSTPATPPLSRIGGRASKAPTDRGVGQACPPLTNAPSFNDWIGALP